MSSEPAAVVRKLLVLDANILIRAVLGRRVFGLLEAYVGGTHFLTPDVAYAEAGTHLPEILIGRGLPADEVTRLLSQEVFYRLPMLVTLVPHEVYADLEPEARRRLRGRDEDDWPVVALALRLGSPIWTEDRDFFGGGVPTWTTDRFEETGLEVQPERSVYVEEFVEPDYHFCKFWVLCQEIGGTLSLVNENPEEHHVVDV